MNLEKLYNCFKEIESNEDLMNFFKYDFSSSWIHVKHDIFKYVIDFKKIEKKNEFSFKIIFKIIKTFLFIWTNNNKSIIFFGSTRGLVSNEKNEIVNIYLPQELENNSDIKYFMTLNSFKDLSLLNAFLNKNKVVLDNLIFSIYRKIFKNKINKSKNINLIIDVLKKYEIFIPEDLIVNGHYDFITKYKFYEKLIKHQKKIKECFLVSSHSKSYIIAVFKKMNVKVTEIQHGLIGKVHIGYDFACDIKTLPIPDKILVYNQFWKEELLLCNFTKDIETFNYYPYYNILPEKDLIGKRYILFTGQGILFDELIEFFEEGITFLKENNIILIYKPHPSEDIQNSKIKLHFRNSNLIVFNEYKFSTEYLIKHSIAHISIQSTCHFDAVEIIGRTYILNLYKIVNSVIDYSNKYPSKFILIKKIEEIKLN